MAKNLSLLISNYLVFEHHYKEDGVDVSTRAGKWETYSTPEARWRWLSGSLGAGTPTETAFDAAPTPAVAELVAALGRT
jgi:hypothetical protein